MNIILVFIVIALSENMSITSPLIKIEIASAQLIIVDRDYFKGKLKN